MNNSDLNALVYREINEVLKTQNLEISKREASGITDNIINAIVDELAKGGRINLPRLFELYTTQHEERIVKKSVVTGAETLCRPYQTLRVKTFKGLKRRMREALEQVS